MPRGRAPPRDPRGASRYSVHMGRRERAGWRPWRAAWAVVFALGAAGCTQDTYLDGNGGKLYQMALVMESALASELATGLVEQRVELPLRPPTEEELARLRAAPPSAPPYPRRPWVLPEDVRIEVDWALHNLSTEEGAEVRLLFNGINEFHEFVPWVAGGDGATDNFSQWERRIRLAPGERRFGTIREDDVEEAARDLAVLAMDPPPNFNFVVHPQTRGLDDPRLQRFRPEVVPGLIGFRMAMMPESAAVLLLEFTVRVRDLAGKIAAEGEEAWTLPEQGILPVVMEEEE